MEFRRAARLLLAFPRLPKRENAKESLTISRVFAQKLESLSLSLSLSFSEKNRGLIVRAYSLLSSLSLSLAFRVRCDEDTFLLSPSCAERGLEASPRLRGVAEAIIPLPWPLTAQREAQTHTCAHTRTWPSSRRVTPPSRMCDLAHTREEERERETAKSTAAAASRSSRCDAPPNELALFCSSARGMQARELHERALSGYI